MEIEKVELLIQIEDLLYITFEDMAQANEILSPGLRYKIGILWSYVGTMAGINKKA